MIIGVRTNILLTKMRVRPLPHTGTVLEALTALSVDDVYARIHRDSRIHRDAFTLLWDVLTHSKGRIHRDSRCSGINLVSRLGQALLCLPFDG
jgi:hypothetical protein